MFLVPLGRNAVIAGTDALRVNEFETEEGVSYSLYYPDGGQGGIVGVYDVEAEEHYSIVSYTDYAEAVKAFNQAMLILLEADKKTSKSWMRVL